LSGYSFVVTESEHLVHGLQGELTNATWAPISPSDILDLVSRPANQPGFLQQETVSSTGIPTTGISVIWQSPRPMSSAAVIQLGNHKIFVKRHNIDVRNSSDLRREHKFINYLRDNSIKVPFVYSDENNETVFAKAEFLYEFCDVFAGIDLYRERISWSRYICPEHAYHAGEALARLHMISEGFDGSPKVFGPLCNSVEIITAENPLTMLKSILAARPGLAISIGEAMLSIDIFFDRFSSLYLPFIEKVLSYASLMRPIYTHGDWHPSNMSWTGNGKDADVEYVFDFGLSNKTFLHHDIAVAIERSCIDWLGLYDEVWDPDSLVAFLRGYHSVKNLSEADLGFIADTLPVCHFEYALSDVEYFGAVLAQPDNAALACESYLFGHAEFFLTPEGIEIRKTIRNLNNL
jgi:tRNA A-37 threonylcarbamoyl transferase component Bud32